MKSVFGKRGLAWALLASGCASADPTYYNLQTMPGPTVPASPSVVEIRRPGLAGYLDRSDIVLRTADYKLNVNSQVRWAEPLGDMIGRVLTQDLAQRLPASSVFGESGAISADADLRVEINIQRFDADSGGDVVLTAELAVERGRTHHPVAARHISLNQAPTGPGAAALAAAMSSLLGKFADGLATDIQAAGPERIVTER